jgi:hypothetical protein
VLGWEVRRSSPDVALLGASGRLGLSGELLFERQQQHTPLFATACVASESLSKPGMNLPDVVFARPGPACHPR